MLPDSDSWNLSNQMTDVRAPEDDLIADRDRWKRRALALHSRLVLTRANVDGTMVVLASKLDATLARAEQAEAKRAPLATTVGRLREALEGMVQPAVALTDETGSLCAFCSKFTPAGSLTEHSDWCPLLIGRAALAVPGEAT